MNSSGGSTTDSGGSGGTVSSNGRFAAYSSYSNQHVAGDTNGVSDVFVYDRQTKATSRVSVDSAGVQGNRGSNSPSLSGDGRYVSFNSDASNLIGGDGDFSAKVGSISVPPTGVQLVQGFNDWSPGLTWEAWVNPLYVSNWGRIIDLGNGPASNNMVWGREGSTNNLIFHVYQGSTQVGLVRATNALDLGTWQHFAVTMTSGGVVSMYKNGNLIASGTTPIPPNVSRNSNFIGGSNGAADDGFAGRIDEVAMWVAALPASKFASHYQARLTNYADTVKADGAIVYWRLGDKAGSPTAVDSGPYALSGTYRNNTYPGEDGALSVDGSRTNDVFIHDRQTGKTTRATVTSSGAEVSNYVDGNATVGFSALNPEVSGDGRYVSFGFFGPLDPADTNGNSDAYLRDRDSDGNGVFDEAGKMTTTRVSVSNTGAQGNDSQTPGISPDARYVAFTSYHPFEASDTNGTSDIYFRDRVAGTTSRISAGPGGASANGASSYSSVSTDGRYVGFASAATNLTPSDTNGFEDTFVKDRTLNSTSVVSVGPNGEPGDGYSSFTSNISPDGKRILFASYATNLVAGDTNGKRDTFVRDLRQTDGTKVTSRVSLTNSNVQSTGPARAADPQDLSADGRYAFFASDGSDLVASDANNLVDGFVRDLGATDGFNLAPSLGTAQAAQSDEAGLEQFYPYASTDLGAGTAFTQLRTGNLVASFDDASIPADGLNAVVRHVYNSSRAQTDTGAGAGWTLGVGDVSAGQEDLVSSLLGGLGGIDLASPLLTNSVGKILGGVFTPSGQVLELTDSDGTSHRFFREGGPCSHWRSPPGVNLKVREIFGTNPINGLPDAYELIRPDGVTYRAEAISFAGILPTSEFRITSVSDRSGNKLTYDYGRFGPLLATRLKTITHNRFPAAPLVRFDYTLLGDLDKLVTLPGLTAPDPASGTNRSWERQVDYDINPITKQLNSVTENNQALPAGAVAAQRTTTFTYGLTNLLASVKDGRNNSTGFEFTGGKLTKVTDRRSKQWTYGYTTGGGGDTTTVATNPVGSKTTYKISPRAAIGGGDERIAGGNITSIADDGHGTPAVPITTNYAWTANRLTSSKDGAGAETTMEYNDLGLLTKKTRPAPNTSANSAAPEAVTTPITSILQYQFPASLGDDPTKCTQPSGSGPVTTEGWCFAAGELIRSTSADSQPAQRRITDFTYDAAGNVARSTERANPDPAAAPSAAPAAGDRSSAFTYYTRGGLKTADGPRSDVADVSTYGDTSDATYGGYDRTGQPARIEDAAAKTKTFEFTPYGSVGKSTDRDARAFTAKYDERNNLVEAADPQGDASSYRYDQNDNLTHRTAPKGTATVTVDDFTAINTFNETDLPTQVSTPGATSTDPRTLVKRSYADDGAVATETSARDATTNLSYWPNRLLKSADAPASGAVRAVTDYSYDSAGRLASILGPVATSAGARPETKLTYNPDASLFKQEQTSPTAALSTTKVFYDANGEQVRSEGPRTVNSVEAATASEYDRFGQATKNKRRLDANRYLEWSAAYDLAGNQTSTTQPTGSSGQLISAFAFDAMNRLSAQTTDPVNPGHTVGYLYDGEGHQTRRTDKVGGVNSRVTSQNYNPDYSLQTLAATSYNGSGTATERLLTCNFPLALAPATGYDKNGNVLETRTTSVAGAGSGSDQTDCDTGTGQRSQSFTYDERDWAGSSTQQVRSPDTGAMVSRTDDLVYDPDGRMSSLTHKEPAGATFQTSYQYTAAGWSSKTTDWRSKDSTIGYLASGAPSTESVGSATATANFDWFADGSAKELTWKKGTAGTVVNSHKNIAYDVGALRTSEDVSILQPGGLLAVGSSAAYSYDLLDRLGSWTSPFVDTAVVDRVKETYSLDDAGNITTETATKATAGAQISKITSAYTNNRLTGRTNETNGILGSTTTTDGYSYDGLGQETQRTNSAGPSSTNSYNPFGHTKAYDDQAPTNLDVNYVYDTDDQVISRQEPAAPTDRPKATLYFYNPATGALSEEADDLGNTLVRYLTDPNGQSIAQQGFRVASGVKDPTDTTGTWKWLLPDVNGNVATHLIDNQDVVEQATWDPYGRPEKAGSSQSDINKKGSTLGFQGAITDKVTGSLILGPRQYDPSTARFVTPDVFVAGELDVALETDPLTGNRYLFAGANPVSNFDDGHFGIPRNLKNVFRNFLHGKEQTRAVVIPCFGDDEIAKLFWNQKLAPIRAGCLFQGQTVLMTPIGPIRVLSPFSYWSNSNRGGESDRFTPGQLKQFEKQLAEQGSGSLVRSRSSILRRLAEHLSDLAKYEKAGGHTGSVEKEITNFQQQVNAINEVLRRSR